MFCGKIRSKNRKITGQRYYVAFTASFRAVNKCTVCLQVRGIRSDDLSGVLRRDQNEVGKHFKATLKVSILFYSIGLMLTL